MNVEELIQALQSCPKDAHVVFEMSEGGFLRVGEIRQDRLELMGECIHGVVQSWGGFHSLSDSGEACVVLEYLNELAICKWDEKKSKWIYQKKT